MAPSPFPRRRTWKQDLAPHLEIDRTRSLAQIASVVLPYLGVWALAAVVLTRMYSFFHDLTHNSLFASRAANCRWGYLLGFLLWTPYRWWQRQHSPSTPTTATWTSAGRGRSPP